MTPTYFPLYTFYFSNKIDHYDCTLLCDVGSDRDTINLYVQVIVYLFFRIRHCPDWSEVRCIAALETTTGKKTQWLVCQSELLHCQSKGMPWRLWECQMQKWGMWCWLSVKCDLDRVSNRRKIKLAQTSTEVRVGFGLVVK